MAEHVDSTGPHADSPAASPPCPDPTLALEQRVAERTAQLEAAARELEAIYESAPVGLCVFDSDLRYRRINERLAELNGLPASTHIGRTLRDVLPELAREIEPWMRRVLDTNEPVRNVEFAGWSKSRPPVWRTVLMHCLPLRNEAGEACGLNMVVEEITARKRAEEALRESERKYRQLVENLYEGLWLLDREHRTTFVNKRLADLLGYTVEEMLGTPLFAFMDAERISEARRNLGRGMKGLKDEYDFQFQRKDGTPLFARILTSPLFDADGRYQGALAGVVDISARRKAEESLRRREGELREAQRLAHVGSWEWAPGSDTVVWSDELYRIFGRDPTRPAPPFREHASVFGRENFERLKVLVDEALRTGAAFELECRIVRPDGSARWVVGRGEVKRDASGRIVGMRGTSLDITDRKQAELALQRSEALFREVVETVPDVLYRAALPSHRPLFLSPRVEQLLGFTRDECLREPQLFLQHVHEDDRARILGEMAAGISGGGPGTVEYRLRHKDGRTLRWVEDRFTVEHDARGHPVALLGALSDITDRKRAEEALQEADRRKDEFLATLAHELRNPLAPISNAIQLMKRQRPTREQGDRALDMAERQMSQLVRLVDDLLDVSRISHGKITLRRQRVSLGAVIRNALEIGAPRIEAAGHRLELDLPDEAVEIEVDPVRIAQATSNLLINAAKFTNPGGRIRLTARREGDGVVIAVQDTGIGIPREHLSRVFDVFTQLEEDPGHQQGGLGLGLALVRSIVALHGGRVEADSPGRGRGATFTIHLPGCVAGAAAGPRAAKAERPAPVRRRILVVDDDADVADSMAMLLADSGHDVQTAYGGRPALELARASPPDVVLLDIGMAEMDGFEVARRMREEPALQDTVLIALTGWGQEADRERARAAGFDHHLVKPVDWPALESLLGKAFAEDERAPQPSRPGAAPASPM